MDNEKIATTDYIAGQQYFPLPLEAQPYLKLEIYNKKKDEWRRADYDVYIRPHGKKLKTDKTIKLYYKPAAPLP